jgi:tetratricopeptide (TPR) repeat protein
MIEIEAALQQQLQQWNEKIRTTPMDANAYIRRGMVQFMLAQIAESIRDFDRAEQLNVSLRPRLWQRGLSYYYSDRFAEGADQFETDLTVNGQDIEETVWRFLCIARQNGLAEAHRTLLPVKGDRRPYMQAVYQFYARTISPDQLLATGAQNGNQGKFYTHLYLGLYSEVANDSHAAQEHIVTAVDSYPLEDYMWYLARVHKQLRGWS